MILSKKSKNSAIKSFFIGFKAKKTCPKGADFFFSKLEELMVDGNCQRQQHCHNLEQRCGHSDHCSYTNKEFFFLPARQAYQLIQTIGIHPSDASNCQDEHYIRCIKHSKVHDGTDRTDKNRNINAGYNEENYTRGCEDKILSHSDSFLGV